MVIRQAEIYLEVTYRHGLPLAAYYYLPRRPGDRASRTSRGPSGLLVDYTRSGRAIGIEINAPSFAALIVASLSLLPGPKAPGGAA